MYYLSRVDNKLFANGDTMNAIMFSIVDKTFAEWLLEEMNRLDMTQAQLAKRAGISRTAVSNLLSHTRDPGPTICRAIARALDVPPEEVFRKAGLLPDKPEDPPGLLELIHAYSQASDEERERILEIARLLSRRDQ
jgi:transcriptional regulator with XRE-family HTH domain